MLSAYIGNMSDPILTPDQIAAGRKAALAEYERHKATYDAKMAFYDAAENLDRVIAGAPAARESLAKPAGLNQEVINLAATPEAFKYLGTLKLKILLALYQASSAMPSAILLRLREVGAVDSDYPASHISPKLNAYRDEGLVTTDSAGWTVTVRGTEFLFDALSKKGARHAA